MGTHNGAVRYTIGQRKGLGLAMGAPVYVCAKDMQANTVTVGPEENLFDRIVYADEVNWIAIPELTAPLRVTARTRYHQTEQAATVYPAGEGQFRLEFDQPQRAPRPARPWCCIRGMLCWGAAPSLRSNKPLRRFAPAPLVGESLAVVGKYKVKQKQLRRTDKTIGVV